MDKLAFAKIVDKIQVVKHDNGVSAPSLSLASPTDLPRFNVVSSKNAKFKKPSDRWIELFNKIVRLVAEHVGYDTPTDFYASSINEVKACMVVPAIKPGTNDIVYIRTNREYNNHGSNKGTTQTSRKGANTHMKNRKVTLTLFTLASGFPLTLQVTGSSKDATAWTRFCDPDLSKAEYDNITWTKDVYSTNKAAVDAVDAMIQIETDYAEGKLDKDAATEQLKTKYIEWVVAHLTTNPEFVERRVIGLNCENPMSVYTEAQ